MTVRTAVKRQRRLMIETYIPELRRPWLSEAFGLVIASLYLSWLKLWNR